MRRKGLEIHLSRCVRLSDSPRAHAGGSCWIARRLPFSALQKADDEAHRVPLVQWLELKVPPLLLSLGFAFAMFVATRAAPGLSFSLPHSSAIALTLAALGSICTLAAVATFRGMRTTVNPLLPSASTTIATTGVYRLSRNPMYLGFSLALAGWATHLANAAAFLLLPAFVGYVTRFQILPEERILRAKFGVPFEHYISRVRRWL